MKRVLASDQHAYLQVAGILRNQIYYGEIQDRLPSSREIAEAFGLNFKTANKALDILVQEGLVKRVKGKGTFLANPNTTSKTGYHIGLILSDIINPNFALLAEAIQRVGHERGFSIVINTNNGKLQTLKTLIDFYLRKGIQAIILQGGAVRDPESIEYLKQIPLPIIGDHTHLTHIDDVWIDVRAGTQLAVSHLVEKGGPPIGYVSGSSEEIHRTGRFQGYRDALLSVGVVPDFRYIRCAPPTFAGGYTAVMDLIRTKSCPKGVFFYNLVMALGGISAFLSEGIRVPEDVRVAGCDDSVSVKDMIVPTTTVAFSYEEEARQILFLIERRLTNPSAPPWNIRIAPRLIVRRSTEIVEPQQ
jgi:LacI family transcriptional regulator